MNGVPCFSLSRDGRENGSMNSIALDCRAITLHEIVEKIQNRVKKENVK
jgi:hypothetical protein